MPNRPSGCVLDTPAKNSVKLGDLWINLSAISRTQQIPLPYLSRIINGVQETSVRTYRRIATSIGMGLDELLEAIDLRSKMIMENQGYTVKQYEARVAIENRRDKYLAKKGLPVPPRPEIFRLPKS